MNTTQALGRLVIAAAFALGLAPHAQAAELQPFAASFSVDWHGMTAGTASLTLRRTSAGAWSYESHNNARGLFRLALPGEITQSTEFRIQDGKIQPLHFVGDDGTSRTDKDVDLRFDWNTMLVSGTAEDKPVELPVEPGTQDGMSVQIALIHELLQGRTPAGFRMVDKNVVKDYLYSHEGSETVKTAVGTVETQIYRSRRPDSERGTWFWCAPSLGYVPVKVERRNGSKVEWSMRITKLERSKG